MNVDRFFRRKLLIYLHLCLIPLMFPYICSYFPYSSRINLYLIVFFFNSISNTLYLFLYFTFSSHPRISVRILLILFLILCVCSYFNIPSQSRYILYDCSYSVPNSLRLFISFIYRPYLSMVVLAQFPSISFSGLFFSLFPYLVFSFSLSPLTYLCERQS